jgi:monoamine oxidase
MPSDDSTRRHGVTRRRVLGGAGVAAAGSLVGAGAAPAARRVFASEGKETRDADVVVVGGGLSGIAAAHEVWKQGRSVVLLEARNRVGGRTLTNHLGGGVYVESGGVFLLSLTGEHELIGLAREVGIGIMTYPDNGNNIYYHDGQRMLYDRHGPTGRTPPVLTGFPELVAFNTLLSNMSQQVQPTHPWTASKAAEWDGQTFDTFERANVPSADAQKIINIFTETLVGCEPREFSLLYMTALLAGAEGMSVQQLLEAFAQMRFIGGSQGISIRIAERLGSRVVLESPVYAIEQDANQVIARSKRVDVVAKEAIIATPPWLTSRIRWTPELPAQRAQLAQRYPHGCVVRLNFVYDEPFWRAEGLTGESWTDFEPLRLTIDVSPPGTSAGALTAFINGSAARRWTPLPAEERRRAVLDNLKKLFGPRAAKPGAYIEERWGAEQWTGGCLYGVAPPGVLSDYGPAMRTSVGRVHWAGTEVAPAWAASMEGAVRSGLAAAGRALAAL